MYSINDVLKVAKILNIDFTKFSLNDFITGINIEFEHGLINIFEGFNKTNLNDYEKRKITNNDLLLTAKIALAHLNEYPNYYNKNYGLPAFENYLKEINKK